MALHWDLTKVKDTHLLHNVAKEKGGEPLYPKGSMEDREGDAQWAITDTLIWMTMAVDMGRITEDNWRDFLTRIRLLEKLQGAFMHKGGEPYYLKARDIRRRVGLSTNVGTKTMAVWRNRIVKQWTEDELRKLTSDLKAAPDALRKLEAGDKWEGRHDIYADMLGLDPDNYRAADNENWPEDVRGTVTEPTTLRRHIDEAVGEPATA